MKKLFLDALHVVFSLVATLALLVISMASVTAVLWLLVTVGYATLKFLSRILA